MKIVIDIPEKVYNAVIHKEFDANLVVNEMRKSIANGTPLNDIEHEIRKYLEDECINENEANGIMFCLDIIDNHIGKEKP